MGTQIAQITQIFMLAATLFQVPRKSPHIREIREIRERKKHSAVMGTQIFMLLAAQLGVSALQ